MVKGGQYGNKAHPYSENVWTDCGYKKWADIKIGDNLFGTDGGRAKVIDIPFDDISDVYRITLKDGRSVLASENHLWNVVDWNDLNKTLSTKQILENYFRNKGIYKEYKYYIPKNNGIEFDKVELPMNPYLLGLVLGDGCFSISKW
jgi:phosphate starvation-inducible PhoH-like protein